MANETNDFSTPHVGTASSYDFIALGSILTELLTKNGAVTEKARWQILVSVLLGFPLAQN